MEYGLFEVGEGPSPYVAYVNFKRPLGTANSYGLVTQPTLPLYLYDEARMSFIISHNSRFVYIAKSGEIKIGDVRDSSIQLSTGIFVSTSSATQCHQNPNGRVLAFTNQNRLILFDLFDVSLIREYMFPLPILSFDWDAESEYAYISHSYGVFGKYSFSGVVSVSDNKESRRRVDCGGATITSKSNGVLVTRTANRGRLLVMVYTMQGELIATHHMHEGEQEAIIPVSAAASQLAFVATSDGDRVCSTKIMLDTAR